MERSFAQILNAVATIVAALLLALLVFSPLLLLGARMLGMRLSCLVW